jgi:hypothetical protein
MFTRMGGEGSDSVPGGKTGTGVQLSVLEEEEREGGRISSPGWPGRWNSRVILP